jgi:hypothetical protein
LKLSQLWPGLDWLTHIQNLLDNKEVNCSSAIGGAEITPDLPLAETKSGGQITVHLRMGGRKTKQVRPCHWQKHGTRQQLKRSVTCEKVGFRYLKISGLQIFIGCNKKHAGLETLTCNCYYRSKPNDFRKKTQGTFNC